MGTLVAKCYPTKLFLKAADHTYVECGTGGAAWACWGGKTGGQELGWGSGSSMRADKIAGPDERAGITCYLINGVCHQAANRVLLPAGITVAKARGYFVSEALYGAYGKLRRRPCRAPLEQHADVTGDLSACLEPDGDTRAEVVQSANERAYLEGVLNLYARAGAEDVSAESAEDFQMQLFRYMAEYRLGSQLGDGLSKKMMHIRGETESFQVAAEGAYAHEDLPASEFVEMTNRATVAFQQEMANVLTEDEYEALLGLKPGDFIVLADPEIVARAFP